MHLTLFELITFRPKAIYTKVKKRTRVRKKVAKAQRPSNQVSEPSSSAPSKTRLPQQSATILPNQTLPGSHSKLPVLSETKVWEPTTVNFSLPGQISETPLATPPLQPPAQLVKSTHSGNKPHVIIYYLAVKLCLYWENKTAVMISTTAQQWTCYILALFIYNFKKFILIILLFSCVGLLQLWVDWPMAKRVI